jgi:hypothetical protein
VLSMLCSPDEDGEAARESLLRPQFGMYRFDWTDPVCTEFHLSHGERIRLLRESGFEVLELLELRPGSGASTRYSHMTYQWARRWPCEEVWRARLAGASR